MPQSSIARALRERGRGGGDLGEIRRDTIRTEPVHNLYIRDLRTRLGWIWLICAEISSRIPRQGLSSASRRTTALSPLCAMHCQLSSPLEDRNRNTLLRNLTASFLIAISALAHGFWRAGNKLHHFFGAILVVIVAAIVLPVSVVRRVKGETSGRKSDEHK